MDGISPYGVDGDMSNPLPERLKERMVAMGEKPAPLAKRLGFSDSYIRDILRGKAKSPRADKLAKLATALATTVAYLVGEEEEAGPVDGVTRPVPVSTRRVPYGGIVRAGDFLPVDEYFDQDSGDQMVPPSIPRHPNYPQLEQYAWLVRGDSMDQVGILDGMWAVAATYSDYLDRVGELDNGAFVIVERLRHGGSERELTVKEVQFSHLGMRLLPRSHNPVHKEFLIVRNHQADNDTEQVRVLAVVLWIGRDLDPRRKRP